MTDFENLTLKKRCSIFLFFANETFWKIWLTFLQKCLLSIVHTKLPKNLVSKTLVLAKSFVRRIFLQKNSELLLSHWDLQNVLPFHFLDISSCLLSDYLDKTFRVRAARNSAKAQSSGMFNRNKKDSYKVFLHPSICNWFISCFFWLRHEFRKILSSLIMLSAPHIFAHWRNECLKRIRNWGHKMGKSMVVKKLS